MADTSLVAQPAPEAAPGKRRWGLVTAGIVTGTVGVAAVVGGLVLNLKANQMASDFVTKPGSYSPAKEDEQKNYKTLSLVGYGAGAACLVAGAILIGYGARTKPGSSTEVAFLPAVGPGRVGAMFTGAF